MFSNDWNDLLQTEVKKQYFIQLMEKLHQEYLKYQIYPDFKNIFNAMKLTSFRDVLVVIIGQDPYHQVNQSHGLCFSVEKEQKIPKSLHNIFTELVADIGINYPKHGNLTHWANQGVLLLNTVLSVRDSEPGSHRNIGWEIFTDQIINLLNSKKTPIVYLLWGNDAKKKEKLITNKKHLILKSVHPSPLSAHRGFFGCKHFSKANTFLYENNLKAIEWQI